MDKSYFFERNLLALSQRHPELCSKLSEAETTHGRYKFIDSRNGSIIPAWVDQQKTAHPLHSIMDPEREAKRLITSMKSEGFLILLGLGGGYYAEAALEQDSVVMVVVVEYDINSLAELLCHRDYARFFGNPRFRLLVDASCEELEQYILDIYQPVLSGGISVIPLRSRTCFETSLFSRAGNSINSAIRKISADYSVQAHFGRRWFSNIIRNLKQAKEFQEVLPPVRKIAISAAGPSLSCQIETLAKKRRELFLIATDTSLPCLLNAGMEPDAVISIDCQHISYYHFMNAMPDNTRLFLDLASPPLLYSRAKRHQFFSGGHPLTRYVSRVCRTMPEIDTSGGNVTHAAVSLAEQLGAREIELYGADFSYPQGVFYAKGTYIYSYFAGRQNRFTPMEAQASAFLFRTPLQKKNLASHDNVPASWYYETKTLEFYREKLEEKISCMRAAIIPVRGLGAPITLQPLKNQTSDTERNLKLFSCGKAAMTADEFLSSYRSDIESLPLPEKNSTEYIFQLKNEAQAVFATILPAAAAIKRQNPLLTFQELLAETKRYCIKEIDSVLQV